MTMKAKNVVGMAVASALMWSYGAMANSDFTISERHAQEVMTPFAPNEAGPAVLPHEHDATSAAPTRMSSLQRDDYEVATPLSPNESGPAEGLQQSRHALQPMRTARSMANPQTPWSPNEAGVSEYSADLESHAKQVAEVEQARIAASEWNASLAASDRNAIDQQHVSAGAESYGTISSLGVQGATEGSSDPTQQSALPEPAYAGPRSDNAEMPAQVDRTHAMRSESEQGAGGDSASVGVLEVPAGPADQAVWNVEPLTPGADLASGTTVYAVPQGHELVFLPDFGRNDAGSSEEYAARAAEPVDSPDVEGAAL